MQASRSHAVALFLSVFVSSLSFAGPEDPEEGGAWGPVTGWPMIPVSAANLPDGRILAWASNERNAFPAGPEYTYTAVWDPDTGEFTEIPHPNHDMFCSHHVMLEDGSVFVSGGRNQGNSPWTSVFDSNTNQWQQLPNMNRGRWYPTSVALASGEVVTFIGSGGGNTAEKWDGTSSWSLLGGLNFDGPILNYAHGERNWWPLLHLAPDGRIFHSGPTPALHFIDPAGAGSIAQTNNHTAWYPKHGTAVMYDEGKLLSAGGWVDGGNTASVANAMVIDLNGPSPQITQIAPMNNARKFQNGVTLANGEVLIVGGNTSGAKFNDLGSVLPVEIWNPTTQLFRVGAAMAVPRNYHSVALLMVDGRVFSGGGGLCNCAADHQDAQLYSPPYLFNPDGTPATRPVITQIAGVVEAGQVIHVGATPGLAKFSMVKMSTTTHAVNSDLRYLPAPFTETTPGTYDLTLNANVNVLTPGYWMVFGLNTQGTPSVAKVVQVSTHGLVTGPPTIKQFGDMSTLLGDAVDLLPTVSDPDGDALSFSATNLPSGIAINPTSGVVTGTPDVPGSYAVTITVDDASEGTAATSFIWVVYDANEQPGLVYEYFEGTWDNLPDFDTLLSSDVGIAASFTIAPRQQDDFFGFRYRARILIDAAGDYTFFTTSDDGSQLFIDGVLVVDNDGLHGSQERSGTINLTTGPHEIVVTFFEKGGAANLAVEYLGPGVGRQAIPTSVLTVPALPDALDARHVRLVALSEVAGKPWASAAEINLVNDAGQIVDRSNWSVAASSEETAAANNTASNAIDGDVNTIWHSEWSIQAGDDNDPPHPHSFTIDRGTSGGLSALRYLPRVGAGNGTMDRVGVYVSDDGVDWGYPIAFGQLEPGASEKTIDLVSATTPPSNQPPVVTNPGNQANTVGESINLIIQAGDPDGNSLSYTAANLPGGLSISSATGLISGTLDTSGDFAVSVTVDDGTDSTSANFSWDVQEANIAPDVTQPADQLDTVGDVVSLQILASDVNGDPLTYGATGLPAGLGIDSTTGEITGTAGQDGVFGAQVSVSDGALTTTISFAWTVLEQNFAPTITPIADQTNDTGDLVRVLVSASDPNGDALEFSAAGLPSGLSIDAVSGEITGMSTTAGNYTATVTVSDGSLADFVTFDWSVIEVLEPIVISPLSSAPRQAGLPVDLTANATGGGALQYRWSFGDGTPDSPVSSGPGVAHTFVAPGRYVVTVTVSNSQETATASFTQAVHLPHTAGTPVSDSTILIEGLTGQDRVWNVNPDNDTVTALDAASHAVVAELSVGDQPMSIAATAAGEIWVVNKGDATISRIDPNLLAVTGAVALTPHSAPHGLVADAVSGHAYVALESSGEIVAIDSSGTELGTVSVGANVRHLALSADGARLYATRFITPLLPGEDGLTPSLFDDGVEQGGEVLVIDVLSNAVEQTIELTHSHASVSEHSGPGLPNYLRAMAISPDGVNAFVPSKQDNILAGAGRNGFLLDHDHTVRAVTSHIDLSSASANVLNRVEIDNSSVASVAVFGRFGSYLFVALEGNRMIAVLDAYRREELFRFVTGRAPQGIAVAPDGRTLFVHNFMERSVSIHDISALIDAGANGMTTLDAVPTVGAEVLAGNILLGKQHFYDALDGRLALESYMSCASCHNDGGSDGRVWDFTQFGEGVRNTSSLKGQAGADEGPVHWTGNFDELQDFEGQIRAFALGLGLMSNADFNSGTRSQPLGDPKAGLSADLDALAAYVNGLTDVRPSPSRMADGSLTPEGQAGRVLFYDKGCHTCHTSAEYSDSAVDVRHDIGTIDAASGQRMGAVLDGFDTPILRGLWDSAPYLHDGSAATIADAILAHTAIDLSQAEADAIADFVAQIDETQPNNPPPGSYGPLLETFRVTGVGSGSWTTVDLGTQYDSAVVVCTIEAVNNTVPQVPRVQSIGNDQFQVRIQNPAGLNLSPETVLCMAVEEGAWELADGRKIEAHVYDSSVVDENNSWVGEAQSYAHNFVNPVVFGQIMSFNDPDWSVFWSHGSARSDPPSAAALRTGLSVAEDPNTSRVSERVGYVVVEAGAGQIDGASYEAFVGPDSVLGWSDSAVGYAYDLQVDYGLTPTVVASQTAEDGGNGGWAVVRQPFSGADISFSIDEDQQGDSERNHTTEQVAYFAADREVRFELSPYVPPTPTQASQLEVVEVSGVGSSAWTTVSLANAYSAMVAVCNVIDANNTLPQVVRMREVGASALQVRLQNPSGANLPQTETLNCIVTEAGSWLLADGRKLEAQKYAATRVDDDNSWIGEQQSYLSSYASPVVIGQVMSYDDSRWSSFWSRGGSRTSIPNGTLYTGMHVAEDPDTSRASEMVGYLVIEAGSGNADGVVYEAGVGSDNVVGRSNNASGVSYGLANTYAAGSFVVVTMAAMDGNNGGWAVGRDRSAGSFRVSIDEDQIRDSEVSHTTEQVAYVVFDQTGSVPLYVME